MARIRTIKPEFPQSESMGRVSRDARLLFVMLWTMCDDHGRARAHSRMLASLLFPYDDDAGAGLPRWLGELEKEGCIRAYEVEGSQYLEIVNWRNHQKIDKPSKPQFPEPPDSPRECSRVSRERSSEEGTKDQGREGKGEEGNTSSLRSDSGSQDEPLLTQPPTGNVHPHPASERLCEAVLEAYHRILPKCQHVAVLNPKRKKRILAADKLARQLCKQQGWTYEPGDFWESYFSECAQDAWMRGEVPNPRNPAWKQNLDVLLAEDRFAGIMDRAIEAMRREAAA